MATGSVDTTGDRMDSTSTSNPARPLRPVEQARVDAFAKYYPFALDTFQIDALTALARGESVLVAAPTGAGKTVVGEFACFDAVRGDAKAFYTTPIKALSNQKYRDLVTRYGEDQVGLLTGDRAINSEAPLVVMTTEVLRNMIYESSATLKNLRYVVLDEVHYLADRERGAVWEEVIIQLAASVQLVALSATVSNTEIFGAWLDKVRDGCALVLEEHRPVPLRHHYFVNDTIYDTFTTGRKQGATKEQRERASQALGGIPNPQVLMLERNGRQRNRVTAKGRRLAPQTRLHWPRRPDVIHELAKRRWLPAIVFVFSRKGCDDAVSELQRARVRLTNETERAEIAVLVDTLLGDLPDADLSVLNFAAFKEGLLNGIAAHHAGMIPAFKECVEELFQRGLLKLIVATETLALGINMPARTVVIERLEKWNGDSHVLLTPGQYTQLTGRAGRRGIDTIGNAVVLFQRDLDFRTVASLVGTRTYPLKSSFAPSYNMAVNLLRNHSLENAKHLLNASFAQFENQLTIGDRSDTITEMEEARAGYIKHTLCDAGDWASYWTLRKTISAREKAEQRRLNEQTVKQVNQAIMALQPGEVLHLPWLGRRGLVAVTGVHVTKKGTPLAQVIVDDRSLSRLGPRELASTPQPLTTVALPTSGNPRHIDYRRFVADQLRGITPPEEQAVPKVGVDDAAASFDREITALRAKHREHACHSCPERATHETWQYRIDQLDESLRKERAIVDTATGSLVKEFTRILTVLTDLEYVNDDMTPTDDGMRLARVYAEFDLLIAEALRRGVFDALDYTELAALFSYFVYEPRGGEVTESPDIPTVELAEALESIDDLAAELARLERRAGLVEASRDRDAGFVSATFRWVGGADLADVLEDVDITGGDFVRAMKNIADLLGQIRSVATGDLSRTADSALNALRRGIVEA